MITNEKQYKISRAQAAKFLEAIENFDEKLLQAREIDPRIIKAQRDALESQYESLREEIEQYELLKSGKAGVLELNNLADLPDLLIRARIAQGLTQTDLAQRLDMKPQQIQRYESERYSSASMRRLLEIASVLNIQKKEKAAIQLKQCQLNNDDWNTFPVQEMYKRGWFEGFTGSLKQAVKNAEELVSSFFSCAGIENYSAALHRKKIRSGSKLDPYALLAWQARVIQRALLEPIESQFNPAIVTDEWIKKLVSLSRSKFSPKLAKEFLQEHGIYVIVEPHLPGTHLDGAALKLRDNAPIIALTLRHDRIDNFWYVLLHELGHVVKHLTIDADLEFFDDCDADTGSEKLELEADQFADEKLISPEDWETSLARFMATPEAVREQAKIWGIGEAIIAGRIRKEQDKWTILTDMVGQGEVRKMFPEVSFAA